MSQFPHTQEPLHFTREIVEDEPQYTVRCSNNDFPLAVLRDYNAYEMEGNARLYAASPKLLAAAIESLKLLRKGANGWGVSKDLLAQAIFEATGKPM